MFFIGTSNHGKLTVDGGSLSANGVQVGDNSGSTGGLVQNGGYVSVGAGGLLVAAGTGSTGTVVINGGNLTTGYLSVGNLGTGNMAVQAGGSVSMGSTGNVIIGTGTGSTGSMTVTGAGSNVSTGSLTVGSQGAGTLTISSGGSFSVAARPPSTPPAVRLRSTAELSRPGDWCRRRAERAASSCRRIRWAARR